jgi:hypothetical protein
MPKRKNVCKKGFIPLPAPPATIRVSQDSAEIKKTWSLNSTLMIRIYYDTTECGKHNKLQEADSYLRSCQSLRCRHETFPSFMETDGTLPPLKIMAAVPEKAKLKR